MRTVLLAAVLILGAVRPFPAEAQDPFGIERFEKRETFTEPPFIMPVRTRYGSGSWQRSEYWPAKNIAAGPLVIRIGSESSTGSTAWLSYRFTREGFAYGTIGYRIERRFTLTNAMEDIVKGIAKLRENHKRGNFDPDRILLLGFGSGAQIAALLATDPIYLEQAGIPFETIRAVASVNGSGFDIPYTLAHAPPHLKSPYRQTFGKNAAEQARLSPVNHLAPPNAPRFLFVATEDERRLLDEAQRAARTFNDARIQAHFEILPEWREGAVETYLLAKEGGSGQQLIDFFRSAAASPS